MKKIIVHIQLDNVFEVIAENDDMAYKMAILEAKKLYEFDKDDNDFTIGDMWVEGRQEIETQIALDI